MTGSETSKRIYQFLNDEIIGLPSRIVALVGIVLLLLLPIMLADTLWIEDVLPYVAMLAIYALSWNFLSGLAGQFSFGHAFLFAGAGYIALALNIHFSVSPWICFLLAPILGALLGMLMFVPSLRITGPTYGIASFAFPMTLYGIVLFFPDFFGGLMGSHGGETLFTSDIFQYYFAVLLMIGTILVFWKIFHSKVGIIANSIREDEEFTESVGINTTKYRFYIFIISGFFAGLAGGLFPFVHGFGGIGVSTISVHYNFMPILFSVFGGIGTFYGPVLGAYTIEISLEFISGTEFDQFGWLIMGIILIVALLFVPMGLFRKIRDTIEKTCPKCKTRNWAVDEKCRECGENL